MEPTTTPTTSPRIPLSSDPETAVLLPQLSSPDEYTSHHQTDIKVNYHDDSEPVPTYTESQLDYDMYAHSDYSSDYSVYKYASYPCGVKSLPQFHPIRYSNRFVPISTSPRITIANLSQ